MNIEPHQENPNFKHMKILSGLLIAITLFFNGKHAWAGILNKMNPAETKMLTDIGISQIFFLPIGLVSLAICILVLIPQTYLIGNLLNAGLILIIMAMALNAGNIKVALIEIPFLILPLIMIWLGHPLKKA